MVRGQGWNRLAEDLMYIYIGLRSIFRLVYFVLVPSPIRICSVQNMLHTLSICYLYIRLLVN